MTRLLGWGAILVVLLFLGAGFAAQEGAATAQPSPGTQDVSASPVPEDPAFPGAIEPPCLPAAVALDPAGAPQIAGIAVSIPQSRQWQSNLLKALLDPAPNITDEYKKDFVATVALTYGNGAACSYAAEVRVSGDWKDHLSLTGEGALASMDVTLKEGNVDGMVRFKLLLPATRGGDTEILATEILRRAGILSPRTRHVEVTVNGVRTVMLLQENLAKELLEAQSQRESAMLETDESLMWRERAAGADLGSSSELIFPRLSNPQWTLRGPAYSAIGWTSMKSYSRALSETWGPAHWQFDDSLLSGGSDSVRAALAEFRALMVAMRAEHGLINHNRRFYFDPMLGGMLPVYYDGDTALGDPDRLTAPFDTDTRGLLRGVTPTDLAMAQRAIDQIDVDDLLTALRRSGAQIEPQDVQGALDAVGTNLRELRDYAPAPEAASWSPSAHAGQSADFMLVFGPDPSALESCDTELAACSALSVTDEQATDLLRGRLAIDGTRFVYGGPSLDAYRSGTDPLPDLEIATPAATIGGASVFTHGQVDLRVDASRRTLEARLSNESDRVVIRDGQIRDWTISVIGPAGGERQAEGRFDEYLLTGCLTLVDTDLADVSISVEGGLCEDSVNFIRATGTIRGLTIRDSDQDAVDMDFSTVTIGTVTVNGAGNDCLDLSSGNYTINTLVATACADKGLSVGERSTVTLGEARVDDATFGLVAKDSSTLTVDTARIYQVASCASAFRKKQEFGGAIITLGFVDCPNATFPAQPGSEIRRAS